MITNTFTQILLGRGCSLNEFDRRASKLTIGSDFVAIDWPSGSVGCAGYRQTRMSIYVWCCKGQDPPPGDRRYCYKWPIGVGVSWYHVIRRRNKVMRFIDLSPDPNISYPIADFQTEYDLPQTLEDCFGDVTFVVDIQQFIDYVTEEAPIVEYDDRLC